MRDGSEWSGLTAVPVRMVVCVRVRGCVRVFVLGGEGGDGHYQAAVLDAFEADEKVGEVLDAGGLAVNDQDFKTGVVIEMRMTRRHDEVVVLVLHLGELLGDSGGVVVVNERDGADDGRAGRGGLLADQPGADQVAKGFGAVGVSALLNGMVEPLEEIGVEGNADSA